MTQKTKLADLPVFDMAEHLKTDEDIANDLTLALQDDDPSELAHALGVRLVAQASHTQGV